MAELGYLDDEAFARAWVASRDRARPRGEHALRRELQLKGVDRSIVDVVLEERRGKRDRRRSRRGTTALMRTSWPRSDSCDGSSPRSCARTDPRKRRQRAYALLARNGFAPDVCSTATKRVLDDPATTARDADPGLDETDLTDG